MYGKTLRFCNSITVNRHVLQSRDNRFLRHLSLFMETRLLLNVFPGFLILILFHYLKSISAYSRYMISKYSHTNTNYGVSDHVVTPEIKESAE